MKEQRSRSGWRGFISLALFIIWTVLVQSVDVQSIGPMETKVGFATLNGLIHRMLGVHMQIYIVTDWMGLIPILVCMLFGMLGAFQMVKRKSLLNVDRDLLLLGGYYMVVVFVYLIFELVPINYRPVLIEGRLECSYPSSTTLLVLTVMPTLIVQSNRRLRSVKMRNVISVLTALFCVLMVMGRLVSGVHWFTDIIGGVLLSAGLFCMYQSVVI